jgi:hypothetical protein
MEALYERERHAMDLKNELAEQKIMTKEDNRSHFAAEFFLECQIADTTQKLASAKAEELAGYRR